MMGYRSIDDVWIPSVMHIKRERRKREIYVGIQEIVKEMFK